MRILLGLCLLALAVPCLAGDPGDPDPAFALPTFWKGKHLDQLFAEWGKPKKIRRDGKNGKVLVYRLRFYGSRVVGETRVGWSESGIGPSPAHPGEQRNPGSVTGLADLRFSGGLAVIATQKVKFYVDRQGIIQREEFSPRKWKRKP